MPNRTLLWDRTQPPASSLRLCCTAVGAHRNHNSLNFMEGIRVRPGPRDASGQEAIYPLPLSSIRGCQISCHLGGKPRVGTSPQMPPTPPECGGQGPASDAPQQIPSPMGLSGTCQLETSALPKGADLQVENSRLLTQSTALQGPACYPVQWHCAISFYSFKGLKFSATAHYSCCQAIGN